MTLHLADKPDLPPCGTASLEVKPRPKTKTRKTRAKRADLYESVTGSIIKQLEAGRVPWVQPWG